MRREICWSVFTSPPLPKNHLVTFLYFAKAMFGLMSWHHPLPGNLDYAISVAGLSSHLTYHGTQIPSKHGRSEGSLLSVWGCGHLIYQCCPTWNQSIYCKPFSQQSKPSYLGQIGCNSTILSRSNISICRHFRCCCTGWWFQGLKLRRILIIWTQIVTTTDGPRMWIKTLFWFGIHLAKLWMQLSMFLGAFMILVLLGDATSTNILKIIQHCSWLFVMLLSKQKVILKVNW